MRALLTNDDGIDSPGLHELARHVEAAGFEVVVVAPSFDASGTGASLGHISRDRPIGYKEVQIIGLAGKAFALDGPPALCTITSHLEAFGPRPDIVVSGPNLGLNTGRSVLHSGTVGAALAAQNFGMRGLAVSLAVSEEWHFDTACRYAIELLNALANGPERCALNLNVPALPYDQTKGLRAAYSISTSPRSPTMRPKVYGGVASLNLDRCVARLLIKPKDSCFSIWLKPSMARPRTVT